MTPLDTRTPAAKTVWLLAGLIVTAGALTAALTFSGAVRPRELADPGTLVRWALPAATTLHHLAMATTLGALVFGATMVPRRAGASGNAGRVPEHPAFIRVMAVAGTAALVWTLAAVAVIVLGYADTIGEPVSASAEFTGQLSYYMTDIVTGKAWLAVAVMAAVVATLSFAVRAPGPIAATAVLAAAAVVPLSLIGHAAGSDDHNGAVNALALHLLGVCLWVGGVIVLAATAGLLSRGRDDAGMLRTVMARFSVLAGTAFVLVLVSGIINTAYRIGGWEGLGSPYGLLILTKTAATVLLGAIGYVHRRWITGAPAITGVHVIRLIGVEVLIMGAVMGVAVVLGRTPPPIPRIPEPAAGPAKILTGYDLPPELTAIGWITQWRWDWLWVAVAVLAAAAYAAGIRRLQRTGHAWPLRRSVAWFAGLALLVYATSGTPTIYGPVLFSVHTAGHLLLTFAVPLLLTAGRPYRLAALTVPERTDGTLGWREAAAAWAASGPGKLLARPPAAAALVIAGLGLFYYSPLFSFALREHVGHELMNTVFLLLGMVFAAAVLTAPAPRPLRDPAALAMAAVILGLAGWAAYTAVSPAVPQPGWFGGLGRTWGPGVFEDQQGAAWCILAAGAVPVLAAVLRRNLPALRRRERSRV